MKKNKFNAKKIVLDGITFDSQVEGRYYLQLKLEKEKGLIKDFSLQPKFELIPKFTKNGVNHRAITYIADFKVFHDSGKIEIIDIKGRILEVFKIKKKLFEYFYPALSLTILKLDYKTNQFERVEAHDTKKKAQQSKKGSTKRTKGK